MTKTLNNSLVPALILAAFITLAAVAAFPADAQQGIKENCTLSRDITIDEKTLAEGTKVKSGPGSVKDEGFAPGDEIAVKEWGTICLINTVNAVTDWAFFILISVAFVMILFAGFMWMTSRGEPEGQKKAGQMIGAALVGIVIAILARTIPAVITGILV